VYLLNSLRCLADRDHCPANLLNVSARRVCGRPLLLLPIPTSPHWCSLRPSALVCSFQIASPISTGHCKATVTTSFLVVLFPDSAFVTAQHVFSDPSYESRNRPGVAQTVPGGLGSQISWHSAREGTDVVSFTHRPYLHPLPSFSLGAESTPGPWHGRNEIRHWKIQWHHRESIPGPSDQ